MCEKMNASKLAQGNLSTGDLACQSNLATALVTSPQGAVVQQIQAYFHRNCAFNDKSMTFGTVLEYISLSIFSYRAISKSLPVRNSGHFSKWLPFNIGRH